MKAFLLFISCMTVLVTQATNYYLSNRGNDGNSGTSVQQPWLSIEKMQGVRLVPGDTVMFRRGDTFGGAIKVLSSGTAVRPIVYAAYGAGAKPVISGFTTLQQWNPVAPGIWEASLPTAVSVVNMLTMNGEIQVIGRYPNYTAIDKGYLSYESFNGTKSITDNQWPSAVNWKGAEIVIRKNGWVIDRGLITGHDGGTFTYSSTSDMQPVEGYGYFIQNDPRTLDQPGEWYFDKAGKKIRMYFGNKPPGAAPVKASVTDILLTIQSQSNITVRDLSFEGANRNGMEIINGSGITIAGCNILYSGEYAVNANSLQHFTFEHCLVENTNSNALYIAPYCSNTIIRNNRVNKTGLHPGMGKSYNQQLIGLVIQGEGRQNLIENNEIAQTGYSGIVALGDSFLVRHNYVHDFCLTTDDGGGIYSAGDYNRKGRRITGNIVINGKGAHEGSPQSEDQRANGIYMDDRSANVEITGNTVANCSENGIFIHNAHEIVIKANTVVNNNNQLKLDHDILEKGDPIRNIHVVKNIFFSKNSKQTILKTFSLSDDISKFGLIDSNFHVRSQQAAAAVQLKYRNAANSEVMEHHELEGWKTRYGYDTHSKKFPVPGSSKTTDQNIKFEYNASGNVKTVALAGTYVDGENNTYTGSVKIQPYASVLLMKK